jgi:hypothetical protein
MIRGLFALMLAGAVMAALSSPAVGNDSTVGLGKTPGAASPSRALTLPLPPIPELETMPWLTSTAPVKGPKVDTLQLLKPDRGLSARPSFADMPLWPSLKSFDQAKAQ